MKGCTVPERSIAVAEGWEYTPPTDLLARLHSDSDVESNKKQAGKYKQIFTVSYCKGIATMHSLQLPVPVTTISVELNYIALHYSSIAHGMVLPPSYIANAQQYGKL